MSCLLNSCWLAVEIFTFQAGVQVFFRAAGGREASLVFLGDSATA